MGSATQSEPVNVLNVPVTKKQLDVLTLAAERDERTLANYVLHAALVEADPKLSLEVPSRRSPKTQEEIDAVLKLVQAEFRKHVPAGVSLSDELVLERRGKLQVNPTVTDEEFAQVVSQAQAATQKRTRLGQSLIDELIKERRRSAAGE